MKLPYKDRQRGKSSPVSAMFTPDERAMIERVAQEEYTTLSSVIRSATLNYLKERGYC